MSRPISPPNNYKFLNKMNTIPVNAIYFDVKLNEWTETCLDGQINYDCNFYAIPNNHN